LVARPLVAFLVAGLCSVVVLTGCGASVVFTPSPPVPPDKVSPVPGSPIDHIVIIMQENRTVDNLFNGFPGADTAQTGLNNGVEIPLKPVSLADSRDLNHSHMRWLKDVDNGSMDGFAQNGSTLAYSYVPESDVEPYWTLARNYVLGDRMFQSNTGPSFVAHQYLIAGQSANVAENPSGGWGCDAGSGSTAALIGPNGTELPGVPPCFDYQTIADLLDEKGVSWRYYAPGPGDSFYELSAFQAVRHIRYGSDWEKNVISPQNRILTDIAHGELAQVTWVIPDWTHSDHPGSGSLEGPDWVASIVNAIGQSKFWGSTAIFITWDDWGGWYDHVLPPTIDEMGPGFRVPLLIVSPYARQGYVSHRFHEASGFIKFIEYDFNLGTLGTRDAGADYFTDCFDLVAQPSSFDAIPVKTSVDALLHEAPSGPPDDD
jgi:phospholipase C